MLSLAGALVALLATRTSVLRALGIESAHTGKPGAAWCVPGAPPEAARIDLQQVQELRASLRAVVGHPAGGRLAEGIARPSDVWSDDSPQAPGSMLAPGGLWPGAYEIRWRTRRYTVVADAFLFDSPATARRFLQAAASTRCHSEGSGSPAPSPPGARNLIWTNPDGVEQNDVFFGRGRRVYRMGDVLDTNAIPLSPQAEVEVLDAVACRLPSARCPLNPAPRAARGDARRSGRGRPAATKTSINAARTSTGTARATVTSVAASS